MTSQPPKIKMRGVRQPIPSGYLLGRTDPGTGDAQLIPIQTLVAKAAAQAAGAIPVPLTVPLGGTGDTSLTQFGVLIGNGTGSVHVSNVGTAGQILFVSAGAVDPSFRSLVASSPLVWTPSTVTLSLGTVPVGQGGTGDTTLAAHGVLIGNGASAVNTAAPGTSGWVLTSNGASADPTFQAPAVGTIPVPVNQGGTGDTSLTAHGVLIGEGTSPVAVTSVGATGTILAGNTGADPSFQSLVSGTGISVSGLTVNLSVPVTVPNGGTGDSTLAVHGVLIGNGTSGVTVTATGTAGQVFTSGGASADPSFLSTMDGVVIGGTTPAAGTFTTLKGNTSVVAGTNTSAGSMAINGPAGSSRIFAFDTAGALRWRLLANNTAESGSNVGSDLVLQNFDDTGTVIGNPMILTRATGALTLSTPLKVASGGTGDSTLAAHGVLIGNGTSAVSVTATGTAGQVLTSGGASADPSFSSTIDGVAIGGVTPAAGAFTTLTATTPIAVSSGGTGLATITAHDVLIGAGTGAIVPVTPGTAGWVLTSNGTSADPSFQAVTGSSTVTLNSYTTHGTSTWNKPAGCNIVEVIMWGAGGGGGGSGMTAAGTAVPGGSAGGGGAFTRRIFRAADVPSSVTVTVGTGGAGGPGGAGSPNSGTAGSDGTVSSFGTLCSAGPGTGGSKGDNSGSGAGGKGGVVENITTFVSNTPLSGQGANAVSGGAGDGISADHGGAGGAAGSTNGVGLGNGGSSIYGSAGGGAGGAVTAGNVASNGGIGGAPLSYAASGGGTGGTGGAAGTNGIAGTSFTDRGGQGGGGGGASTGANNGGAGGAGGTPGGGGGGGAGTHGTGKTGGAGGAGGDGAVYVWAY